MALGVSSESMSAAAKNLRDKGRMRKVAGVGALKLFSPICIILVDGYR
jgi:hypothetical protein